MPLQLFDEAELLLGALKCWSVALYAGTALNPSMRIVLELLLLEGPTTVPAMARVRRASRQHIQQQVDALVQRGLVERRENPAHKRSSLIALTDKGRALTQNMRAEARNALSRMQVGVSDKAMSEAAQVLSAWRSAFEQDTKPRLSARRVDHKP